MYKTGVTELDSIIGGLRPGELTVIAGRTGMGTGALCRAIAKNIRRDGKNPHAMQSVSRLCEKNI